MAGFRVANTYQFSPRLADAGDARLWRMDPQAHYGALNGVARNRIDTALIARHWDDLLRMAGSLQMGGFCISPQKGAVRGLAG